MTTGLAQHAHRLVELARAGDDPTATQLLGLHGAIAARVSAEAAMAAEVATTVATTKAASAGALVKGLVAAAAIATGAGSFVALQSEPAPPVAPPPAARTRVVPAPVARAAAPEPLVAAVPAVEAPPVTPSRPSRANSALRLQDEAALLAEVQGSLRSGQAAAALSKLESYDKRFPAGMLRSEADAARVFALCAAGRVEKARTAAARFVQRYPNAPVTARVQSACK
jgi:hypothetical protein